MRRSAVQLTEKGQRLVSELARESRKPPAKVIEAALESYRRQKATKLTHPVPRRKVVKVRPSDVSGWDKWVGYCRKSFEGMGNPSVDEYIEMVRGR